ncbi:DUF3159 domain-containing protein [Acaricomes phytoseiuli]|uniref:DUF3159 domain-containing protein n=1 Tax=Acaricomes phytoseiuli TaxID=291968 RepID=UPI000363058F|nr:DUF3159 domain-containing protein [Acaricomes phytoseiuli]MCW1249129.1 DUF3159 domain-containing protein [Acaricomes phytoseiuli]
MSTPAGPPPGGSENQPEPRDQRGAEGSAQRPNFAELAETYASRSGLSRNEQGHIDLRAVVGGWRGLMEAILPGLVFLVSFITAQNLILSLVLAVSVGVIFTVLRLIQRGSLMQSFSGLAGIVICALFSGSTGKALDFYIPGFITNLVSITVLLLSIVVRWPITGILFGFLRGEEVRWRSNPQRLRAYTLAAWIMVTLFVLRLVVQYPLFLAGNLPALGATRLAMGVPLYAFALWLAWMVSRPAAVITSEEAAKENRQAAEEPRG